ncbi:hypothetical protein [Kibdelosporangium aridum]|uniref:hypothetical protein n=1 Tax=Kibdelosporangium aridum TaxID=2030 RepID=UPI000F7A39F9|nr:hypothetical protein [Kibdelosporangium aridum]
MRLLRAEPKRFAGKKLKECLKAANGPMAHVVAQVVIEESTRKILLALVHRGRHGADHSVIEKETGLAPARVFTALAGMREKGLVEMSDCSEQPIRYVLTSRGYMAATSFKSEDS